MKIPEESKPELARLLIRHQQQIYAFIYSMLPVREAAEDVLQETCVTIVEKFSEFREDTNFIAWANTIAFWKVRQARVRYARSKLIFQSERVQAAIASSHADIQQELFDRHEALDRCLKKLNDRDRKFILTRYKTKSGVSDAAELSGRTIQATYKALGRIRRMLGQCVAKELAREDFA